MGSFLAVSQAPQTLVYSSVRSVGRYDEMDRLRIYVVLTGLLSGYLNNMHDSFCKTTESPAYI